MNGLRLLANATILVVACGGLLLVPQTWFAVTFEDGVQMLLQENRRSAELKRSNENWHGRIKGKFAVTRDLVTGRLSLRQAAARFREVEQEYSGIAPGGESLTDEDLCREVINWTLAQVGVLAPGQKERVLGRSKVEFADICKREQVLHPAGEITRPDLGLPSFTGTLAGTVVDAAGRPVVGAKVIYYHRFASMMALTDERGAFLLRDLPEGPLHLQVQVDTSLRWDGTAETGATELRIPLW